MVPIDFLNNEEVKAFIKERKDQDVARLMLNPPKKWKGHMKIIADQILSRQKARGKIPSWVENFDLIFPPPISIEQASSESTGRYKRELISGNHLVDLTGGMGIDCLWLSENFKKVTYVEQQAELCHIYQHNLNELGKVTQVVNESAESYLSSFKGKATFYLDPARRNDAKRKVFRLEDCTPNLSELQHSLSAVSERTLIKLSPLIDITALIQSLDRIAEIHVVSVKNECKEVLAIIDRTIRMGGPEITAVNLDSNHSKLSFHQEEERTFSTSGAQVSTYLYEPNASILKAGAFNTIAERYPVKKLQSETHLYTSGSLDTNFPGRVFEVLGHNPKNSLKKYAPEGHINVITRNYATDANKLKKKLSLKDGGNYFLIGFKDLDNKPQLVIAERLL